MSASFGLLTVAGRLATFDSGESAPWPHTTPSPEDLAHAGFYYTPTALSPDNLTCFICERSLDGWEEGDNPFAEHLRFSPQCGWAITLNITQQSSDPARIVDPTSSEIAEARRATFISWPHDGKRGWVCKTDKMVEAGWYFCPNEESDDLVSCPYCKLSLDGWERTDNPFDEHYRRSSDCSFFEFAKHPKKGSKSGRGKTARSSKASRLSAQSNATTISEAPTVDLDDTMDQSMLSQSAIRTSKASAKTSKSKSRNTKSKREIETDAPENHEAKEEQCESTGRGTKRKSNAISGIGESSEDEEGSRPEPEPKAKKKRVTATRTKKAQRTTGSTVDSMEPTDDELGLDVTSKPTRTRKKGSTSKGRKTSTASNVPGALKSQIPNDEEIDAALEADLDKDLSIKPAARNTAEIQLGTQSGDLTEPQKQEPKGTTKKKAKKQQRNPASLEQVQTDITQKNVQPDPETDVDVDEPVISIPTQSVDLKKPEIEPAARPTKAKQSKKAATGSTGGQKKKANNSEAENLEAETTIPTADVTTVKASRPVARLSKKKSSRELQETERHRSHSLDSQSQEILGAKQQPPEPKKALPQFSPLSNTPSPSPQSSDAENQPPSSRPSTMSKAQPSTALHSGKGQTRTLSPSGAASSSRQHATPDQWIPIDLDEALLPDTADKENISLTDILQAAKEDITSPEKRMSIEEWVFWNAKKGEEKLRSECERVVSIFEKEGGRAMHALDGIECID